MGSDDKAFCFHVVHSMKGGCGKSAFSLFKSITLANNAMSQNNDLWKNKARVLYVDADFKGTSTKYMLYAKDKRITKEIVKVVGDIKNCRLYFLDTYKDYCLNDYFINHNIERGEFQISDLFAESIVYDELPGQVNIIGRVDFIFSSFRSEDKSLFRFDDKKNEQNRIRLSEVKLAHKMGELLRYIYRKGRGEASEGQYTDVIIDMPPGYDSYSDFLMMELRKLKEEKDSEIQIHYYSVSTNDRGHLESLRENISDIFLREAEKFSYTSVNAVLCCMEDMDFSDISPFLSSIKAETSWDSDKIHVYKVPYTSGYRNFCREKHGDSFPCVIESIEIV